MNDDLGLVIFFEKVTHDNKTEISVVLFFGITIAVQGAFVSNSNVIYII